MIIFAIVLTTVLLTTTFTIALTMSQMLKVQSTKEIGTIAEASYKDISLEAYDKLSLSGAFNDISYSIYVGEADYGDVKSEIRYIEEKAAKWNFCELSEGRFPESEKEILIDNLFIQYIGGSYKLGDTISLMIRIGDTIVEKELEICGFYEGNQILGVPFNYVSKEFVDDVVYGIREQQEWLKLEEYSNGKVDAFCRLDNTSNAYDYLMNIWRRCDLPGTPDIGVNWALENQGLAMTDIAIVCIVVFMIIIAGYLMIYNVFYISIINDVQFYGRLKVIGMCNRHIRSLLNAQLRHLCMVGIPIGLGLGWGLGIGSVYIIFHFMDLTMTGISVFCPEIFLYAVCMVVLTVYISVRKPFHIIKEVSPIQTTHYTGGDYAGRERRIKKKFSLWRFSFRNISRNKKRNILVVASFTLVIILFTFSAYLYKSIDVENFINNSIPNDIFISSEEFLENFETVELKEELVDICTGLDGTYTVTPHYIQSSLHFLSENALTELKTLLGKGNFNADTYKDDMNIMVEEQINTVSERRFYFDRTTLERLNVIEGTVDYEEFLEGNYCILFDKFGETNAVSLYHVGEKILLNDWTDETSIQKGSNGEVIYSNFASKEYTIMAIAEPYGAITNYFNEFGIYTVLPLAEMEGRGDIVDLYGIGMDTNEVEKIERQLKECLQKVSGISYKTVLERKAEYDKLRQMLLLFSGGMTFFIGVMAVSNFMNNFVTGVVERKTEFITLRQIGMKQQQVINMLKIENFYLLSVAAIIGSCMGGAISKFVIIRLQRGFTWLEFEGNFVPVLVLMGVLFLFIKLVSGFVYRKVILENRKRW